MKCANCPPLSSEYGGEWHCYPPVDSLLTSVAPHTLCVLECHGHDLDGLMCQDSGVWSPHDPGHTVCHLCPPPDVPEFGTVQCSDQFIGVNTSCRYECESEVFYFTGEQTITCHEDGSWSAAEHRFQCHLREVREAAVIVGGVIDYYEHEYSDAVDVFDGVEVSSDIPRLPWPAGFSVSSAVGSVLVLCPGEAVCDDCDVAECIIWEEGMTGWLDPRSEPHYQPPHVMGRSRASAVLVNDTVWMIGGQDAGSSFITEFTVEIFKPGCVGVSDCQFWSVGPEIPDPVHDACSLVHQDTLFITGGVMDKYRPPYSVSDISSYDLITQSWSIFTPLTRERYGHGCAMLGDKMVVSGGYSYYDSLLDTVEMMNMKTETWSHTISLISPREKHVMMLVNTTNTHITANHASTANYGKLVVA